LGWQRWVDSSQRVLFSFSLLSLWFLFVAIHITMVIRAVFVAHTKAMITGRQPGKVNS